MFNGWNFRTEAVRVRDFAHTLAHESTDFLHTAVDGGQRLIHDAGRGAIDLSHTVRHAGVELPHALMDAAQGARELPVQGVSGARHLVQGLGSVALDLSHTIASWGYDLIDLLNQQREAHEIEQRGDGDPLAAPPFFIPNYFNEGWIPGCQYFVYLRVHDPYNEHIELGGERARGWSPTGEGGLRSNDIILPVWGPVVGIEQEFLYFDVTPRYRLSLISGGYGCGPIFAEGRIHAGVTQRFYADSFLSRLGTTYGGGSAFLFPGLSLSRGILPHQELWISPPKSWVDQGRIVETPPIFRRELDTLAGKTAYLIGVRRASSIPYFDYPEGERAFYGVACAPRPTPSPPPPPLRQTPPPMCCNCEDIAQIVDRRMFQLYKVLGFPMPRQGGDAPIPPIQVNPESLIESSGAAVYAEDEARPIEVKDIPSLMVAIASATYFRAGYHRLPAEVPKSLTANRDSNETVKIEDALSWQEWQLQQLDALIGQFPVKIKVKGDDGKEEVVAFENIAEALAELAGLNLSIAADVDFAANLAFRAVLEASKAGNAALIAQDYAKANAQFLGYKGNQIERKVQSTITPGQHKKSEFLKKSEQTIIGWTFDENNERENLQSDLKQLLLAAGIIKAALVQPWEPGDGIIGDYMRESQENTSSEDEKWEAFLAERRYPPQNRQVSNTNPEIKDLSHSTGEDDVTS